MEKQSRHTWYVRPDEKIIYPSNLKKDPDSYGGLGAHMACAIHDKVITIPLQDVPGNPGARSCVSIQVVDKSVARRIAKEGKLDILSSGWWCDINSTTPVFAGTDDPIPMWGRTVGDSLERIGLTR